MMACCQQVLKAWIWGNWRCESEGMSETARKILPSEGRMKMTWEDSEPKKCRTNTQVYIDSRFKVSLSGNVKNGYM